MFKITEKIHVIIKLNVFVNSRKMSVFKSLFCQTNKLIKLKKKMCVVMKKGKGCCYLIVYLSLNYFVVLWHSMNNCGGV